MMPNLEMLLESGSQLCRSEWYADIPKSRILYGLPSNIRGLLGKGTHFEPRIGTAREGMKSFDNERYIRLWWEVSPGSIGRDLHWHRLAKGGGYSLYYSDLPLLLNWQNDGAQLCATNEKINGSTAQVQQASTYWYMPGVTYSKRSAKGFSARALPADTIFTSNGPAILPLDDKYRPEMLLGWLNTRIVRALVQLQANFADYSTGSIKTLPWIVKEELESLRQLGENAIVLSMNQRAIASLVETNTCFGMDYFRLIRLVQLGANKSMIY